jgi:hypothetical protein
LSILGRKLALIMLLAPLFAFGQGSQLPKYTVANLPAASTQPHYIVQVIDGVSSTDCFIGGGSQNTVCISNGTSWTAQGSIARGGTGATTAAGALANLGAMGWFTYAGSSTPSATCSAILNNGYIAINATPTAYQCSNATGSYAWNTLGGSSFNPASPGPIGGTTPSTGAFTNLTASGTVVAGSTTPTTIGSNGVLLNGVPALQAQTSLYNYYSGGAGNLTGTGSNNTAQGGYALYANTTGSNNTANGFQALFSNTTGSNNTANGNAALYYNTTGAQNTANGNAALYSNTTGFQNTANGMSSLFSNTTGSNNTAQGGYALYSNTTGSNNTANGNAAGLYIAGGVTANRTSSNSVYEGFQAYPLASGDTNENVIGNQVIGHGSNTTTLGNSATVGTWLNGTQHITATAPITSAGYVVSYSSNAGGEITGLSAATSVTITFANSGWTNAAFCVANSSVAATQPYVAAQSNTAVTFTFPALTGNLFYHCDGN